MVYIIFLYSSWCTVCCSYWLYVLEIKANYGFDVSWSRIDAVVIRFHTQNIYVIFIKKYPVYYIDIIDDNTNTIDMGWCLDYWSSLIPYFGFVYSKQTLLVFAAWNSSNALLFSYVLLLLEYNFFKKIPIYIYINLNLVFILANSFEVCYD